MNLVGGSVSSAAQILKEKVLSEIYDSNADRYYEWISYKYAKEIPLTHATDPSPPVSTAKNSSNPPARFEELPNVWVTLAAVEAFHSFLNSTYTCR